jgi:signal peptidase I
VNVQPNEQPVVPLDDPAVTEVNRPSSPRGEQLKSTLGTIGLILIAPLIALCLTLFVFQSYQVDGPSMQQTLHNNDRLIVWKLPRTWAKLTGHQYVPGRGDIIILNEGGLESLGGDASATKQLVKRVIGLPGDRVVIHEGVITIYNTSNPDGIKPDEELPYAADAKMTPTLNEIDVTLGPNEIYVCGDNRSNSLDSRMFGPIKTDQVVGKLVARILPLNQMKRF